LTTEERKELQRPLEPNQYTSDIYGELAKRHGIEVSMRRRGNCWDYAVVESFFSLLKDVSPVEYERTYRYERAVA